MRQPCTHVCIGPVVSEYYYYGLCKSSVCMHAQLSLSEGDEVVVLEKVNGTWWWAELDGVTGYVPTNHLSSSCPGEGADRWQDHEYFSSYNTLVCIAWVGWGWGWGGVSVNTCVQRKL